MMVVLYHAAVQPEVKAISYILCLPGFFFVSGLFANVDMKPGAFFQRKSMRLIIPYTIFGVSCWILWLVIGRKVGADTDQDVCWWLPLWGLVCGKVELLIQNRPLWFLCCMLCTEWLYYVLSRVSYGIVRWLGACLIACLGCVLSVFHKVGIWEITAAMLVFPLYVLGAEGNGYFCAHVKRCKNFLWILILILSIIGISIGYFCNPDYHISTCQVGNPLLFYIAVFSVVGFWLTIAISIDKKFGFVRWLSYLGQNTLIVLCTHLPLFGAIKGVAMLCGVSLSFFVTNIGSLALWLSSLILLFPLIYIINHFFPFLIGKKRLSLESTS